MTLATSHRVTPLQRRHGVTTTEAARQLHELVSTNGRDDDVISRVVEIAAELTGALGVVFLHRDASQQLRIEPKYFSSPHLEHLQGLLRHMMRLAMVVSAEGSAQAGSAAGEDGIVVVVVPVFGGSHGIEALAVAIGVESEAQARTSAAYLQQMLTWVAAFLASLRSPKQCANADDSGNFISLREMLAEAGEHESFESTCQLVAERIRVEKNAGIVAIGVRRGWQQQCQLVAKTGGCEFDNRSETVGCLCEVMEETIIADSVSTDELDESLLRTSTADQLTRLSALRVSQRYPLRDIHDNTFGVVLFLSDQSVERQQDQRLSSAEQSSLGMQLGCLRAAAHHRLLVKLGIGQKGKKWFRHPGLWSALGAFALLMMLPMPLIVKCPCRVQPQHRRFVSVPYEGRLQQALTEPGEVVRAGQLLARMDDRDVTWEISKVKSELRRAEKERDTSLAAFDTSASQLAGLETERLRLHVEELQDRLDNLEIRSPIDGIVIGGDPRKFEGARLSMGETLLEIGPLDKMVVELEVPDEDISYLQPRQTVQYRLNALPQRPFHGTIDLIRPQSELRDDANVFVAESEMENPDQLIRPGMRGKARIKTARHPLGWNLFHKSWSNLMTWIAW